MRWARNIASMRALRNLYKILFEKPERERPLGGANHR